MDATGATERRGVLHRFSAFSKNSQLRGVSGGVLPGWSPWATLALIKEHHVNRLQKGLTALVLLCAGGAQGQTWDLNELSVLMPLPRVIESGAMWTPRTSGGRGELLPASTYGVLPQIVMGQDPARVFEALRVVALRFDPCFQEGTVPGPCQRQVRLVWQPLVARGARLESGVGTIDASVHSFHILDEAEWRELVRGLRALKARFPLGPGLPLQVHPWLAREGYGGPFWAEFQRTVLPFLGDENIGRVTAMTVNPRGNVWVFLGFDRTAGRWHRQAIPRANHTAQGFFSGLVGAPEFRADMNPRPEGETTLLEFFLDSAKMRAEQPEERLIEAVRRAHFIENPRLSNAGTVDCASCHAARAIPAWAEKNYPAWAGRAFPERFVASGNAVNLTVNPLRTNVLRAFGYFGADPVIAQRTINETALILTSGAMNSR